MKLLILTPTPPQIYRTNTSCQDLQVLIGSYCLCKCRLTFDILCRTHAWHRSIIYKRSPHPRPGKHTGAPPLQPCTFCQFSVLPWNPCKPVELEKRGVASCSVHYLRCTCLMTHAGITVRLRMKKMTEQNRAYLFWVRLGLDPAPQWRSINGTWENIKGRPWISTNECRSSAYYVILLIKLVWLDSVRVSCSNKSLVSFAQQLFRLALYCRDKFKALSSNIKSSSIFEKHLHLIHFQGCR